VDLERVLKNSDVSAKRKPWRAVLGVVLAGLLVSCGGEAIDPFRPDRIMAFGDEWSVIDDGSTNASPGTGGNFNGRKYTVNSSVNSCAGDKIWIQVVADAFNKGFQQCPGNQDRSSAGRSWAEVDADVDAVDGQVTAFQSRGGVFGSNDLVLVLAGFHDILNLYIRYKSPSPPSDQALLDSAGAAGMRLGRVVVRITDAGAKVIVADLPDLGRSPYGNAEQSNGGAMLTRLTDAFNDGLLQALAGVKGGGHSAGLVQAADLQEKIFEDPNNWGGFLNLTDPACKIISPVVPAPAAPPAAVSTCVDDVNNVNGLNSGTNAAQWLWADNLRYTPCGHAQLGNAALNRAFNNPF
jgi:outer membrane lipase/esterase